MTVTRVSAPKKKTSHDVCPTQARESGQAILYDLLPSVWDFQPRLDRKRIDCVGFVHLPIVHTPAFWHQHAYRMQRAGLIISIFVEIRQKSSGWE
jgi:hypothetical protein